MDPISSSTRNGKVTWLQEGSGLLATAGGDLLRDMAWMSLLFRGGERTLKKEVIGRQQSSLIQEESSFCSKTDCQRCLAAVDLEGQQPCAMNPEQLQLS